MTEKFSDSNGDNLRKESAEIFFGGALELPVLLLDMAEHKGWDVDTQELKDRQYQLNEELGVYRKRLENEN